jgi:hypothetical protein
VAAARAGASDSFRICPSPACRVLLQPENLECLEKLYPPVISLVYQSDSVGAVPRVGPSDYLFQTALLLWPENPLDFQ